MLPLLAGRTDTIRRAFLLGQFPGKKKQESREEPALFSSKRKRVEGEANELPRRDASRIKGLLEKEHN